tara:strand:- start:1054 stop:1755 length:702 start_codon:yes stop_codon:yes gene_type:complete
MIKLYEKDQYLKNFEAEIKNIDKENELISLNKTAFYGKGGGQPGDIGTIINGKVKIEVEETIKIEEEIFHKVNTLKGLNIGEKIQGYINWEKRYQHMRMHTALHILCAVVPMGVTGGQIGEIKSRLDFNADSNSIKKEEIQKSLNQILKHNHAITYKWIENSELEKKPELVRTMSVKPPSIDTKIRLVQIGDIDLQPCGGTHVKNTSEIGSIIIGKIENKGKMNKRINISLSD